MRSGRGVLYGSDQADAERDDCYCKNHCSNIDEGDRSVGLSCGLGKHGKEEARRNENCSERYSNSNEPEEGDGERG